MDAVEIVETKCSRSDCTEVIRATFDDDLPLCEKHQGEWNEVLLVHAIIRGEMPELREEEDDGDG